LSVEINNTQTFVQEKMPAKDLLQIPEKRFLLLEMSVFLMEKLLLKVAKRFFQVEK
jgi:hypothetical protein